MTEGDTAAGTTLACAEINVGGDKEVLVQKQTQLEKEPLEIVQFRDVFALL